MTATTSSSRGRRSPGSRSYSRVVPTGLLSRCETLYSMVRLWGALFILWGLPLGVIVWGLLVGVIPGGLLMGACLQAGDAVLHRGQGLRQPGLQGAQALDGVLIRPGIDLCGPRAGLIEHGLCLALGGLVDARLVDQLVRVALCLLDDAPRFRERLLAQPIPLGHELARLLYLLGQVLTDRLDDLRGPVDVDHGTAHARDRPSRA